MFLDKIQELFKLNRILRRDLENLRHEYEILYNKLEKKINIIDDKLENRHESVNIKVKTRQKE